MKKKALIWVGIAGGVVMLLACLVGILGFSEAGKEVFYTRIDNSCVKEIHSRGGIIDFTGGMPYSYTLPAYSKGGTRREVSFGTRKHLREGAYLRLELIPIRGVVGWEEVTFEELPAAVQEAYQ